MEIDEYYTLRHYIGRPYRHPAHLWRKVSIVLRFPIRLSLLHREQRDQYRLSSSSSAGLMEFDPFIPYPEIDPFIPYPEINPFLHSLYDPESDIYRGLRARHLWGIVITVLRFAVRLSLLLHKRRDQYRRSSSSSAGLMKFDTFRPCVGRPACGRWRKVRSVLRFAVRLSLLHRKQRDQYRPSSSLSAGFMEFDPFITCPEIDPFIHYPEFDIYRGWAAHLWRKVSIVLRFAIHLSLLHHERRDQYRPSSSLSAGFMEFDSFIPYPEIDPFIHYPEFDIYRGWAAHLWRKVSIVLRFAIRLSLLHHKQRDQYRPSSSSSSSAGLMEIDPFIHYPKIDPFIPLLHSLYDPEFDVYRGRRARHLWGIVITVLQFALRLSLLHRKRRDQYGRSSSSSASLMEFDTFRPYVGRPARDLWRKVRSVLRFGSHHQQPDQYRPSSSAGSMEIVEIDSFRHFVGRTAPDLWRKDQYRPPPPPPSSSLALRSPGKVAYICVWTIDKYEWYAFDVSDDIKHNQTPPPAKYINYPIPFHEDDEFGVVNLKPQVTANMDWILGWEILGFKTLCILDDWKGPSAWPESNQVDRIDLSLISSSPWDWEPVQNMPNQISASAHTCVLGGKFYCFGGGHGSQKVESVGKSRLAMPYYLSSKAMTSPPPPPCLNLDKILSAFKEVPKPYLEGKSRLAVPYYLSSKAGTSPPPPPCLNLDKTVSDFKEVPKPYLPSQNLELEGQSLNSKSEHYVHKQLSSAIKVAITKRYILEEIIYTHYLQLENLHTTFRYLYFIHQKYRVEKLFHYNYVRQKYFHQKLLLAIKDAQPCSLSLNSPVMDYFLKAVSLVEELFRPSVEEYQLILKAAVVLHMLSVEEFQQLSVQEFQQLSVEECRKILLEDFYRTSIEGLHKALIEKFEEFHKTSVEGFLKTSVEESHKTSVEEFLKTSVEEFLKTLFEEFLKTSEFLNPSVLKSHSPSIKPVVEEFLKSSVEEFLKPRSPSVEEFFKPRFPCQNMELERQSPWVMAYDTMQNKWESLLDPPCRPVKIDSVFTAAREFPNQCIVVGLPEDGLLQIYHVNTKQWEKQEFKICPKFGPKVLTGPALSVDSKLYWYLVDELCLVGYDLVTKMWFVGNFPIHDHGERFGVRDVDTPPRLAHLSGDNFCLLWVSVLQDRSMKSSESKDNCISRLHCMKLRVTTGNLHQESGIISLEVSILSCQSYLASGLKFFRGGLVVDGHSRYPAV